MEKITIDNLINYLEELRKGKFPFEPADLHNTVMEFTEYGTNLNAYSDPDVKYVIDDYLEQANGFLFDSKDASKELKKATSQLPNRVIDSKSKQEIERRPAKGEKTVTRKRKEPAPTIEHDIDFNERIPEEIKFIRRFAALYEKKRTKHELLLFINAIHKAIMEKRIRKDSPYAKQIMFIQDKLLKTYNNMAKVAIVPMTEKIVMEFKELVKGEKVYPSIQLIKRYINLNGKFGVKDKAKQLIDAMTSAYEKGKVNKSDKYIKLFDLMHANLSKYVKNKGQKILSIAEPELNGLNGILSDDSQPLEGQEENFGGLGTIGNAETEEAEESLTQPREVQPGVMSSMDFKKIQFATIGFTGKYRDLIGDPSPGFSAMVFGRPKMGKSHLCVDFAGYLARNHGKVLYVAKEEGLDYTLQEKLKANNVAHPNLDISATIPEDLSMYSFVFLDSVNSLGLSTDDLEALKAHNSHTSFIQIFQTTKTGSHKGDNGSQHNVDVVIEVPEKGLAVQNGRFNQGGEMQIFSAEKSNY